MILSFSLFRVTLCLVREGSNVELSGEGEGTGVECCGGRWWQTRYADGGIYRGRTDDFQIKLIRKFLRINLIRKLPNTLTDQVDP